VTAAPAGPFVVIGENVHASRTCARRGPNVSTLDGSEVLTFQDAAGRARTCMIAAPVARSKEYALQRLKHVKNALLLGMAGDGLLAAARAGGVPADAACDARAYLVAAAVRQERAGARFIDVNVDDIDEDLGVRRQAMEWLVRLLEPELGVPLALDSSSSEVLDAGLRASQAPCGQLLLNSASLERQEVLGVAAELHAAVVLSAVWRKGAVPGITQRLESAETMLRAALGCGLPQGDCYVDLLVLPAGIECDAGSTFLGASRAFRAAFGHEVHLIGGLSNISFGLPNRRLLNEVFVALALDASVDTGILDPVTVQIDRVRALERSSRQFRLAAAVVLGDDRFAAEYLAAHRAGALLEPPVAVPIEGR
jgi:5-methyltetrahydrofolate--homocysteine methyltransferase